MIPKSSLDTKDIIDTDIDIDINFKYFLVMRPCILDRCDACVRINELATVQIDAKLKLLFAQQTLSRLPLSRLGELHAAFHQDLPLMCVSRETTLFPLLNTSIARDGHSREIYANPVREPMTPTCLCFSSRVTRGGYRR